MTLASGTTGIPDVLLALTIFFHRPSLELFSCSIP
jgi:hypothetical protein